MVLVCDYPCAYLGARVFQNFIVTPPTRWPCFKSHWLTGLLVDQSIGLRFV